MTKSQAAKVTAATIVLLELRARRRLRARLRRVVDEFQDEPDESRADEAAAILLALLAEEIAAIRKSAWAEGAAVGAAQLSRLTGQRVEPAEPSDDIEAQRGNTLAERFSHAYAKRVRERGSYKDAARALRSRLDTIAATETVTALMASKHKTAMSAYRDSPVVMLERWNAILDKAVCDVCKAMDGKTVQMGHAFEGGLRPGWVHPRCRCFSTYEAKALPVPFAA